MKSTTRYRRRAPVVSLLTLALLGAMSMPAWAADPSCLDADGNPTASSTDQGIEDSEGTTGENATCNVFASAYGYRNNASGNAASAATSLA